MWWMSQAGTFLSWESMAEVRAAHLPALLTYGSPTEKKSDLVGDIVHNCPDPSPPPSCGQLCDLSFLTRYPQK